MFQNRRTVFIFIYLFVFLQALYYIITFQLKRNSTTIINFPQVWLYDRSSDIGKIFVQNTTNPILLLTSNNFYITSTQQEFIPFADASFLTTINFTTSNPVIYNSLLICQFSITNNESSYLVKIDKKIYPYQILLQVKQSFQSDSDLDFVGIRHNRLEFCQILCGSNRIQQSKSDWKDSDNFRYGSDRDYLNPMGSCQAELTWVLPYKFIGLVFENVFFLY
jgi:hypothetical protein